MVPEEIARFLETATVGMGTTRDDRLVPLIHQAVGWAVGEDRRTLICLFPTGYSAQLLPSLEGNGQFSFTALGSTTGPRASSPPNPCVDFHECYQFKGEYVSSRSANEDDRALVDQTAARFKALFRPLFGFSEAGCDSRFGRPVLAVTIEVREVYDQTPGPGAGARVAMEER